jgi:hypothetical protein
MYSLIICQQHNQLQHVKRLLLNLINCVVDGLLKFALIKEETGMNYMFYTVQQHFSA